MRNNDPARGRGWRRTAPLLVCILSACATVPSEEPAELAGRDLSPGTFHQDHRTRETLGTSNAPAALESVEVDQDGADIVEADAVSPLAPAEEPVYTEDGQQLEEPSEPVALPLPETEYGAPSNIWQRIRAGFVLPDKSHPQVATHVRWYASHPAYIERTVQRARPFLYHIIQETERRGMPAEIALLPVVESAFQPFAYSHGRASGIWQFIPGTAKRYGLRMNWWYDGRRDMAASTNAALNYLQDLHRMFDGDWLLALAAYNTGEGNVARAIARNKRAGKRTDFWSLKLPRETRGYVPRLLAISAIVANPEAYGLALHAVPDEHYLTPVHTDGQIDLTLVSELSGLTVEEIYHLNAGFNRWTTEPHGSHTLLLPLDKAADFSINLAAVELSKRVRWARHQVKTGETLGHLARHYRTTPQAIREVNNLRNSQLRVGQSLQIPTVPGAALPTEVASAGKRADVQAQVQSAGVTKATHVVQSGESLWALSRRYGVTVTDLALWNNLRKGAALRVGQRLTVIRDEPRVVIAHTARGDSGVPPPATPQKLQYVVRKGDSLYRIASRFGVTVASLLSWNASLLGGKAGIRPGQRLTLWVDATSVSGTG